MQSIEHIGGTAAIIRVVLLLGWRIVPARAGTAVGNENSEPKISQLCGNKREFPG